MKAGSDIHVTGQRLQQGRAQRPFAVARFDVDVAAVLDAHELAAPGPRIGAGQAHRAIRVVAAGHQHAAVRQLAGEHGRKVAQDGAALRVGRGHQQGALDARCGIGRQVRGGNAAQAVRHDDDRFGLQQDGAGYRGHPRLAAGRDPVVLLHAHGVVQAPGPQALPVAGAGVTPAGNDDETHLPDQSLMDRPGAGGLGGCHENSCKCIFKNAFWGVRLKTQKNISF